jgi:hypothetical protein
MTRQCIALVAAAALAGPAVAQETDAPAPGQKYLVTWTDRPVGSYQEYEAAQERVLQLFQGYEVPESLDIQQFVVRVGEYGGYMIVQTDDLAAMHEFFSVFGTFRFEVDPVLDITDAVAAEVGAIDYRKALDAE